MTQKIALTLLFFLIFLVNPLLAQEETRFPQDAQRLWELARDLWASTELQASGYIPISSPPQIAENNIRQSCLLLEAAVELDPENTAAWHDLVILYTSDVVNDPGRAMEALLAYNELKPKDTQPVETFLYYRLHNLNDRLSREQFLLQTIPTLQDYPYIQSLAYNELGVLAQEKLDTESARTYFEQAYAASNYNDEALARILTLPWPQVDELNPDLTAEQIQNQKQINDQQETLYHILRWRRRVLNNPYDFQALMALITILEGTGRHNLTQDYYEHAYTLLTLPHLPIGYEIPDRMALAKELRFKQMVSCYLGELYDECITIAQSMLKRYPDDLLVTGLLAKAMLKLHPDATVMEASLLLREVADKAMRTLLDSHKLDAQTMYRLKIELAWFFCFFDLDPVRALQYARMLPSEVSTAANQNWLIGKAPSVVNRSNSILAYANVLNHQWQKAEELLQTADPNDPVTALAEAKLLVQKNQNNDAIQTLRNVDLNFCGILAEPIEALLQELQPDSPSADSTAPAITTEGNIPATEDQTSSAGTAEALAEQPDMIETTLASQFNNNDLSIIKAPEKIVRCSLWLSSDIFQYDSPIKATIHLTNVSNIHNRKTPVILAPNHFLDPHLLITAQLHPAVNGHGDTNHPLILAHRDLAQKRTLEPGQANSITENLCVGPLRTILENNPRQTYRITFRLYLDPVPDGQGGFQSKISALQPEPVTVIRKAFIPTNPRMKEYIRAIRSGTTDERIKATRLFTALLREMKIAPHRYRTRTLNTKVIRELIHKNLRHSDFRTRGWTAQAIRSLSPFNPLETKLLGDLINDKNWFARFMAVQTISPVIDLNEYYRWSETLESHAVLKRQIQWLQGKPWQVNELPEIPLPEEETESDSGSVPTDSGVSDMLSTPGL